MSGQMRAILRGRRIVRADGGALPPGQIGDAYAMSNFLIAGFVVPIGVALISAAAARIAP